MILKVNDEVAASILVLTTIDVSDHVVVDHHELSSAFTYWGLSYSVLTGKDVKELAGFPVRAVPLTINDKISIAREEDWKENATHILISIQTEDLLFAAVAEKWYLAGTSKANLASARFILLKHLQGIAKEASRNRCHRCGGVSHRIVVFLSVSLVDQATKYLSLCDDCARDAGTARAAASYVAGAELFPHYQPSDN